MPNRVVSLQHPGTGSPFPGVWFEKQIAMKRFFLLLFLGACPAVSAQVRFSDYFLEETMRFDYYHSGDSRSEEYFFDALKAEPYWAGSHVSLLDTTGYGNQFFRIVDRASERESYSRGFCTLFNEWQSTAEADSVRRSYPESVVFPYPRRPCRIEIFGRNAGGTSKSGSARISTPHPASSRSSRPATRLSRWHITATPHIVSTSCCCPRGMAPGSGRNSKRPAVNSHANFSVIRLSGNTLRGSISAPCGRRPPIRA